MLCEIGDTHNLAVCSAEVAALLVHLRIYGVSNIL